MEISLTSRLCLFLACCTLALHTSRSVLLTGLADDAEARLKYAGLEKDVASGDFTKNYQEALDQVAKKDQQIAHMFLDEFIAKGKGNEGALRAEACRKPLESLAADAVITLARTEQLFEELNQKLYEYEKAQQEKPAQGEHPEQTVQGISVVLGGKLNEHPVSIADTLVKMLVDGSSTKVIGVSRTASDNVPKHSKYQHVSVKDLFSYIDGYDEALRQACDSESDAKIVFYFTLAKYSGADKPRATQLEEAQDTLKATRFFATALKKHQSCIKRMHVVLTGTAATEESKADQRYKISSGNYYYAVSKLAQAYALADALGPTSFPEELKKLDDIISATKPKEEATIQSNIENVIDPIAKKQKSLRFNNFGIVDDLTIIFSSMHSKKYTENAKKEDVLLPFVSVFNDVLRRLDVAMSLKTAAHKHIVIADRIQRNWK